MTRLKSAAEIQKDWDTNPRWAGIKRTYTAEDVVRLRGTVVEESTLARRGAERLWSSLHEDQFVRALGALTGNQAVQMVKAGLKAIYLSGWQVAADANLAGQTYPDQSLYPANSVPAVVRRINNAFTRADQIACSTGKNDTDWFAPIVADAEAGFGGALNAFELMKSMITAGAAGVHWEDQLASEKKCGHLGGKVLIPTAQHVRTLNAARLAADLLDVPSIIIARTDALAADHRGRSPCRETDRNAQLRRLTAHRRMGAHRHPETHPPGQGRGGGVKVSDPLGLTPYAPPEHSVRPGGPDTIETEPWQPSLHKPIR